MYSTRYRKNLIVLYSPPSTHKKYTIVFFRYSLKKNSEDELEFYFQYGSTGYSGYVNLIKVKNKITNANSVPQSH